MIFIIVDPNRWYDERGPPDRRPPHDDFYRDRPPYPEDPHMREPAGYPPHPEDIGLPSEPPRIEKKPETVPVESIVDLPGRESRPDRVSMGTDEKFGGKGVQGINSAKRGHLREVCLGEMMIPCSLAFCSKLNAELQ